MDASPISKSDSDAPAAMEKEKKIGSYFFGLVNGKTQFHIAWDFIKEYPSVDTSVWMHDLYHADFTPYDQEELDILKKCNEDKNIWK